VAYAKDFHGGFIQWQVVVICISCALFVTSQLSSYVSKPTCIFFHPYSPYFMCHCTEYKLSALL